jgi:AraC-like DNA-binding protein
MIENLNAISFHKYGRVIHEGFSHACSLLEDNSLIIAEKNINTKTIDALEYLTGSGIIIDIVDGIALLFVTITDTVEQGKFFLLDKTVSVNPGVSYNVVSLYGNCTIKCAYMSTTKKNIVSVTPIQGPLGFYPKVDINKVHTLFYQEKEKGFTFKGERHDFWELTYVDKGIMYTKVEDTCYKLNQGELIFYGKGQHHTQWSEAHSSASFVTITFDMYFEEYSFLANKKFVVDYEMRGLIEKIINEKEENSYYADDMIICYLKQLIVKLIRNEKLETTIHQQESGVKNRIENSIISKCIDFIHNNIGSKITVPDVAGSIPISQSYLSAIFKKYMNMTVIDYINSYRLEKGKDLIRSTEYNFTQISELLGYTSLHYFSSQFKLKYGVSLSEYAKSIKR